jgi:hypothetical protein
MLRCPTCHNFYMPRSFRQHARIPIISKAATCHDFYMLRSLGSMHAVAKYALINQRMLLVEMRGKNDRQNQARGAKRRPALSSYYLPSSEVKESKNKFPSETLY